MVISTKNCFINCYKNKKNFLAAKQPTTSFQNPKDSVTSFLAHSCEQLKFKNQKYCGKKSSVLLNFKTSPSSIKIKSGLTKKNWGLKKLPSIQVEKKVKNFVKTIYELETYQRSNQDTCLIHRPAVFEGQWIESGDLLADCSSSLGGELSLGQNLLVGYMPWEGFNYEDAILISQKLVYDDIYTSIHIEKYEIEVKDTLFGPEEITKNLPVEVLEPTILKSPSSENTIELKKVLGSNNPPSMSKFFKKPKNFFTELKRTSPSRQKQKQHENSLLSNSTPFSEGTTFEFKSLAHLDDNGIAKLGSWIEEGSILVGKITPLNVKEKVTQKNTQSSPYQKLLYNILDKKEVPFRDSSVRAPKGIRAKVIDIKIVSKKQPKMISGKTNLPSILKQTPPQDLTNISFPTAKTLITKASKKSRVWANWNAWNNWITEFNKTRYRQRTSVKKKTTGQSDLSSSSKQHIREQLRSKLLPKLAINSWVLRTQQFHSSTFPSLDKPFYSFERPSRSFGKSLLPNAQTFWNEEVRFRNSFLKKQHAYSSVDSSEGTKKTNEIKSVKMFLAEKRRIQVGDKMSGRHGNKGIVSQILPIEDMPYLPDGTCLDIVLNPLGVPSRMNVGQIYECLLGLAGKYLGEHYSCTAFDEMYGSQASRSYVLAKLFEARKKTGLKWLLNPNWPGKIRIFDGRTGESFDQPVTVGQAYILRLVHMVDDKLHARSTGPYSLVTQQPLRGRSKQGGQRLGEMEVWAFEGYGAAFTLLEMLTLKSDDMTGRMTLWSNLILNKDIFIGTPESFKVLVSELQALCLDVGLFKYDTSSSIQRKILKEIDTLMNLP